MVGIVILVVFIGIAIYALTQPIPWTQLQQQCASNGVYPPVNGCLCTYSAGTVSPGANCYQTPAGYPSDIAPTIDFSHGTLGPLPLGSITVAPTTPIVLRHLRRPIARVGLVAGRLGRDRGHRRPDRPPGRSDLRVLRWLGR